MLLLEQAASCDDRPQNCHGDLRDGSGAPDLYRTLSERFGTFIRGELAAIAALWAGAGRAPPTEVQLDTFADTVVALLAYHAGPVGASIPRERLTRLIDDVLIVLLTGLRGGSQTAWSPS